ncbi:MAG: NTP transferase domain-containing protein [Candidatus Omnitrophota bacterium]|nr:NTP transferase domain-containing protein [Candidatus Omnitrophota bacterium]
MENVKMKNIVAVILAAGKGTRMKSSQPKVLHQLCGRPMIDHLLDTLKHMGLKKIIVVAGYQYELVSGYLKGKVGLVRQRQLSGTANALLQAQDTVAGLKNDLLVLCADTPLITLKTMKKLVAKFRLSKADCAVLTTVLEKPGGYGRVIRNNKGRIIKIVEDKDATAAEQQEREINSGNYIFNNKHLFRLLKKITLQNKKREYYLTDIISLFAGEGLKIESVISLDPVEALGINSKAELAQAEQILRQKILNQLMNNGVTILDPKTTYIGSKVKIGRDSIIYPYTFIEGEVIIGRDCQIGPFCRIRERCRVADNAKIGNFVELVRSDIGKSSRIKHHSYIGDCIIKSNVNIGAGTIIANYNGKEKNQTFIGRDAFIGSGTILIAPVKIGRGAVTGAGSVVTARKDVPPHAVVAGIPAKILRKKQP